MGEDWSSSDAPQVSGREADDKYNPASILNKIGADIVFGADVTKELVRATSGLLQRKANNKCKLEVLIRQIIPAALYRASKANWPLARYRQLDKRIQHAYYRLLDVGCHGFPHKLLYLPHHMGGIGVPRLSDLAQQQKWSALQRAMNWDGPPGEAVSGMLNDAINYRRLNTVYICARDSVTRSPTYLRSLVEWLAEMGLVLTQKVPVPPRSLLSLTDSEGNIKHLYDAAQRLGVLCFPTRTLSLVSRGGIPN